MRRAGFTTYAANRSVSVAAPDADGVTVIDFNRAVNLPCAYTDFATCPLPPAENRLPVAIEAGEKTPLSRVHATRGGGRTGMTSDALRGVAAAARTTRRRTGYWHDAEHAHRHEHGMVR